MLELVQFSGPEGIRRKVHDIVADFANRVESLDEDTIVDFKPQALPVVRLLQQPDEPSPGQAFGATNFIVAIVGFVEYFHRELAPNEVPQVCFENGSARSLN